MRRQPRSKAKTAAICFGLVLCVGMIAAWRYFRPKIQTASKAEIRAVLPADMLGEDKTDVQALVRTTRLTAISRQLAGSDYGRIAGPEVALKDRGAIARRLWAADTNSIDTLEGLLKEGPLQCQPAIDVMANNGELDSIKAFARCLSFFAMAASSVGDFDTAARAIDMDLELSHRMQQAGGGFIPYVVSASTISATENAIQQVVRTPGCPTDLYRKWLAELPTESRSNAMLQDAIREDFEERTLPRLSQPTQVMRDLILSGYYMGGYFRSEPAPEEYEGVGSYDPITTAKSLAQIVELRLSNAIRPLADYNDLPDNLAAQQAHGLPDMVGRRRSFERVRFRLDMNTQPNSIGRAMILLYTQFGSRSAMNFSCHWRTMNACTQVLLASKLYGLDHDGKMPDMLAQLVPKYLGSLPMDPYTGRQLFYDPSRQIVWSTGLDLKNDGGDIYGSLRFTKDVGLYLGPVDSADKKKDMSGAYDNQVRGTTAEVRRINAAIR